MMPRWPNIGLRLPKMPLRRPKLPSRSSQVGPKSSQIGLEMLRTWARDLQLGFQNPHSPPKSDPRKHIENTMILLDFGILCTLRWPILALSLAILPHHDAKMAQHWSKMAEDAPKRPKSSEIIVFSKCDFQKCIF